jgi:putative nucleotidyltransferase with HDIG domain
MILDKGLELAAAKTGSIMLLDYDTNYLTVKVARGMARDIQKKVRVKIGEGIAGHVFKTGNPLLIRDIENAGEFSKKSSSKYETHSLISVPLKIKERCIGVFNINNKQDGTSFNDDDLATIALLAAYASISIDTARLYDNLSKSIISIVKLATNALEAKDSYTAGHSERVTEFGTEIAKAMGLEEERIEIIRQAGLLHDIGKIGINDAVLLKPSRLTEEEFEIIKTHPAIGYAIVAPMEISLEVREAILHHHERYDGRGYPDGQKNDEISLEARVLCVADSFDAMTSTRAYRKSLPNHIVAKELIKCSGSQFDPEVVQVFLDILKERQFYTDEDMDAINEELEKDKAKGGRY